MRVSQAPEEQVRRDAVIITWDSRTTQSLLPIVCCKVYAYEVRQSIFDPPHLARTAENREEVSLF